MRVAQCVIATGRYKQFLPELLITSEQFFCHGHDVQHVVFTDEQPGRLPQLMNCRWVFAKYEPWPGPTLHRYRTMLKAEDLLRSCDYVYYVDVDSRFVRPIGDEIFGDLVATIHFGFADSPRREYTYDTCPMSTAHIGAGDGKRYYCGGFQGGKSSVYLEAIKEMDRRIAIDERKDVIALWHDESHWNRYLIDHPPTLELPHDYMCPAPWRPNTQRIVIVGKDANAMRRPEDSCETLPFVR